MTMYHMAMPPHFGGVQPPPMHSSIFPGPLLPPDNHTHTVNSYRHQPTGNNSENQPPPMIHSTPIISQGSNYYPTHHPSVYINPYMGSGHHLQPNDLMSHHALRTAPHSHSQNIGFATGNTIPIFPSNHVDRRMQDQTNFCNSRRQPLSVDKELIEEMNALHLGYLETEDSPQKMEQREKLEDVIMEYLAITPHSRKFTFQEVLDVLENSVMTKANFSAHEAACAFDALAQYAANLISQPWRKEFRQIKLHNGFWVHQVASQLTGAEYILELIGYVSVSSKNTPSSPPESGMSWRKRSPEYYVLQGVIDPDLIARLALDCMIAYCECQCLNKIKEGVAEFDLSWGQVLQYRQLYIGGIDLTLSHLLFTLRQRINHHTYPAPMSSPDPNIANSPPPVPVRQSSSYSAACSSPYLPPASKPVTPTGLLHSPLEPRLETSASMDESHSKTSLRHSPDNQKNRSLSLTGGILGSGGHYHSKMSHSESTSHEDKVDGSHSVSSCSMKGSLLSPKVPTAKLIDLDASSENSMPYYKSNHLLPKVLPHKHSVKSSSHQNVNRLNYSSEQLECPLATQPPPEAFQAGTLEEHLEATLNLVKTPLRNSSHSTKGLDGDSLESWDFVYKNLEKKGYNKDIGDRGDILHDMARQKNYTESTNTPSGKNINLNLNNQVKDVPKNRPLTMNQALHQFNLHETKEKVDRPPSSKSSHSISHAYAHENHKRNSLYDNVSGAGFETANQDSDDSDDRRSSLLKKINNVSRQEASFRTDSCTKNCDSGSGSHKSSGVNSRITSDLPAKTKHFESHDRNTSADKNWACITCTYENKSGVTICEMCGKSRDPGPDSKPLESGGKQCPLCTLINDRNVQVCSACGVDLKGSSTYI